MQYNYKFCIVLKSLVLFHLRSRYFSTLGGRIELHITQKPDDYINTNIDVLICNCKNRLYHITSLKYFIICYIPSVK